MSILILNGPRPSSNDTINLPEDISNLETIAVCSFRWELETNPCTLTRELFGIIRWLTCSQDTCCLRHKGQVFFRWLQELRHLWQNWCPHESWLSTGLVPKQIGHSSSSSCSSGMDGDACSWEWTVLFLGTSSQSK